MRNSVTSCKVWSTIFFRQLVYSHFLLPYRLSNVQFVCIGKIGKQIVLVFFKTRGIEVDHGSRIRCVVSKCNSSLPSVSAVTWQRQGPWTEKCANLHVHPVLSFQSSNKEAGLRTFCSFLPFALLLSSFVRYYDNDNIILCVALFGFR